MSFDQQDPRITAYVFDELDEGQRHEFEAEMARSPELREVVEQTRTTLSALEDDLAGLASSELSEDQRAVIENEIKSASARSSGDKSVAPPPVNEGTPWLAKFALPITVAASLLLLVGFTWSIIGNGSFAPRGVAELGPPADASAVGAVEESTVNARRRDARGYESKKNADPTTDAPSAEGYAQPGPSPTSSTVAATPANTRPASQASSPAPNFGGGPPGAPVGRGAAGYALSAGGAGGDVKSHRPSPGAGGGGLGGLGGGSGIGGGGGAAGAGTTVTGGLGGRPTLPQPGGLPGEVVVADSVRLLPNSAPGLAPGLAPGSAPGLGGELPEPTPSDLGAGPGRRGDQYSPITDNPFIKPIEQPLSTFSIDVDTASYSKVRQYLMSMRSLPRPDAVRIEEMVNYFPYGYEGPSPSSDIPFASHLEASECPWNPKHQLVRVAIKGREIEGDRPASNLVFLLDVSGSMRRQNKLPLLKRGMKMLVDQLTENDRVAIVVYAGAAGLVLESTNGDEKATILDSLDRLRAGGSTNGGAGIQLAYQTAMDNFITGGVNRVILCTDGDFNVGTTGTDELVQLADEHSKTGVFLSVLGFGMGNHNDAMLEKISNKGNGNYAFIDTDNEARKVLVEQMSGTLVTIAKDVKIQVEFNPAEVGAYRLIGYENRILAARDFNDDKKDAGEIGAGHTVTALYEIVPRGKAAKKLNVPDVDDLKYQKKRSLTGAAKDGEMLTLKIRYKQPDGDKSSLLTFPLVSKKKRFGKTDKDFRFAASVAAFGMLLRGSPHKGEANFDATLEIAQEASSDDPSGYRSEFIEMVRRAKELSGQ